MKPQFWIVIFAIVAIALLEAYALHQGIDGTLFSVATSAIGGAAGYTLKTLKG